MKRTRIILLALALIVLIVVAIWAVGYFNSTTAAGGNLLKAVTVVP